MEIGPSNSSIARVPDYVMPEIVAFHPKNLQRQALAPTEAAPSTPPSLGPSLGTHTSAIQTHTQPWWPREDRARDGFKTSNKDFQAQVPPRGHCLPSTQQSDGCVARETRLGGKLPRQESSCRRNRSLFCGLVATSCFDSLKKLSSSAAPNCNNNNDKVRLQAAVPLRCYSER